MSTDRYARSLPEIISLLEKLYPKSPMPLHWKNGYQLLIGVMLSANTTDRQVNSVTPALFSAFPTARALAQCRSADEIEPYIKSVGLYRSKAAHILQTARILTADYRGHPPRDFDALVALPGVGRKTAHVIRGALYNTPAIIVDTHFSRVTQRLGITDSTTPYAIERDIAALVSPSEQYLFSQRINQHGRVCCRARKPACAECELRALCRYWRTGASQGAVERS